MALFVKGQSGNPAGRTPKKKIDVYKLCEEQNFNPFLELIALIKDPETRKTDKVDALKEICQYVAPKLKAMEISFDEENNQVSFNVNLFEGKTNEK